MKSDALDESHDILTGLPSRRMFDKMLTDEFFRARYNANNVTLMLIGLDFIKSGLDTLTQEIEDGLLVLAAKRICMGVPEQNSIARLRKNEFAVVIPNSATLSHLELIANNLVEELSKPFDIKGQATHLSVSIGIATYPIDADSADNLMSYADQSMCAAKKSRCNDFQFYSQGLSASANARLVLERELRHGLKQGELELYYQPKVNLVDGSLFGSEALIRWNSPQRGMVLPDQFIEIAEESGLIVKIGAWVMRDACRTACHWNGAGKPLHKVAINLSPRQFHSGDLVKTVSSVLTETGCHPEWIELEITETVMLDERGDVLKY